MKAVSLLWARLGQTFWDNCAYIFTNSKELNLE